MAGRGPAPKETRSRARDQRRVEADLTVIANDGITHGPELPDSLDWPDVTRDWWDTWRRSAQAQTFTETDWSFLLDTAVLHMEFWDGNRAAAPELRLRVAKFGATPEDRARLKISVGEPAGKPAPRTRNAGRKERLLQAVNDGSA